MRENGTAPTANRIDDGPLGAKNGRLGGGAAAHRQTSPVEHVAEIQKGRLLAAMVEVCAERGAANVSVAHVVARAGVSRRTFYEVFEDREECFLCAFDEAVARGARYVFAAYDPQARWIERLRAAFTGLLSFLVAEPNTGRLLIVGSLGAGPKALEHRRGVLAAMIAFVDEGRRESRTTEGLPPLTAEGVVGGVLSVLHSRLVDGDDGELMELAGPLVSMIVLTYLGPAAARKEFARPAPSSPPPSLVEAEDPLRDLGLRLTYRTVRVLMAVAATPGGSNRQVADHADISDQGQISKLLARLGGLGLIENTGAGSVRGAPNSWILTDRGWKVQAALAANVT